MSPGEDRDGGMGLQREGDVTRGCIIVDLFIYLALNSAGLNQDMSLSLLRVLLLPYLSVCVRVCVCVIFITVCRLAFVSGPSCSSR